MHVNKMKGTGKELPFLYLHSDTQYSERMTTRCYGSKKFYLACYFYGPTQETEWMYKFENKRH